MKPYSILIDRPWSDHPDSYLAHVEAATIDEASATSEQLSGVGFSSTNKDEVLVRVATAKSNRVYNVKF